MVFDSDFQVVTNMNTTDLEALSSMAEEGKLKPVGQFTIISHFSYL